MSLEKNIWTVYEHISPNGKKYVGITSNLSKRWKGKGYYYCTYNSIFKRVIEKYGWDNIIHNVVASNLGYGTACNIEKDLISFNKNKGISYNITDGGEGTLGRKDSQETRNKKRETWLGKKLSDDHKKAISEAHKTQENITISRKNLKYAHEANKGRCCSEETKRKMSESAKRRVTEEQIIQLLSYRRTGRPSVPIIQLDLQGNFIKEYASIKEAQNDLNKSSNSILNCLAGRSSSAFGYKWKYK